MSKLLQDAEERSQKHGCGTEGGSLWGCVGVGGVRCQIHRGELRGGQPGGLRTKETSKRAERMQREHDHSSTKGHSPIRKKTFFMSKKNGFDFPRYKKH